LFRPAALAFMGAVVLTAGAAHAQAPSSVAERAAVRAEVPWYERFTYSSGPSETMTGLGPSDRVSQPNWSLSQRWGVTVDVRQREGVIADRATNPNESTLGAFYQFTPSMRVGGAVSLRQPDRSALASTPVDERDAGVRLESAFRF
jgi:hypothetical protein